MNWVDFAVIVVIALVAFSSLRAGFVRQAFAVAGFIVSVYYALGHYKELAARLASIGNPTAESVIAFLAILVVVWMLAAVIAAIVHKLLVAGGLGWADHLTGLIVGLIVGLFVAVCFLLLLARIPIRSISQAVEESSLASYIFMALPYFKQLLPADWSIFQTI